MTLRDYFAGQVLAAIDITAARSAPALDMIGAARGLTAERVLAKGAYEIADAMLAEREAPRG